MIFQQANIIAILPAAFAAIVVQLSTTAQHSVAKNYEETGERDHPHLWWWEH